MDSSTTRRRLLKRLLWGGLAATGAGLVGAEGWALLRRRPMEDLYGPYPARELLLPPRLARADAERPNVIVIYCDDLGYADLGCYGSRAIRTPNVDRLAREGLRCTDYYACSGICSPSRAGLLTGRYPFRAGMTGNPYPADEARLQRVLRNFGRQMGHLGAMDLHEEFVTEGLSDRELTLAAALKAAGYRTAMIGKWHLGDFSRTPEYHPLRFGFDRYFGVPHSNDMRPCPLYRDEQRIADDVLDILPEITGRYTAEAVRLIEESKGQPFFLYLAHMFPHQPLAASARFAGRSAGGKYGDAVEEIDWSTGEILAALERNGLANRTLVIFTSDNGPWYEGSAGELRGGKGQAYDGAYKVPFVARWPGRIPAHTESSALLTNLDLFPTLLDLAGVALPADRVIDGVNILGTLRNPATPSPREAFFYYHYDELQAVRAGTWKYIRKTNRYAWPIPLDAEFLPDRLATKQLGRDRAPLLYDLARDPGEKYNVIASRPDVARRLERLMADWERANRANPRGFAAFAA